MFRPPGGMAKSGGITMLTRCGSISTTAPDSITSVTHLNATQHPENRDMAMPCRPRSRYSWTFAGLSTGMQQALNMCSLWCARVEDLAAWSSPASTSTPPCLDVPAEFACLKTSPQRSTPGPLPYHIANTPSYFASGYRFTCCVPQIEVAARSSLTPGWNLTWCSSRNFVAFQSAWSNPPSGEPRYPEMNPAVFRPAARSRTRCSIGRRTSACVPVMKARPDCSVYLSSSVTSRCGAGAFICSLCRVPRYGREDGACLHFTRLDLTGRRRVGSGISDGEPAPGAALVTAGFHLQIGLDAGAKAKCMPASVDNPLKATHNWRFRSEGCPSG